MHKLCKNTSCNIDLSQARWIFDFSVLVANRFTHYIWIICQTYAKFMIYVVGKFIWITNGFPKSTRLGELFTLGLRVFTLKRSSSSSERERMKEREIHLIDTVPPRTFYSCLLRCFSYQ